MSATEFAITLDCANAADLAAFWSQVLGRPVDPGATEEFAAIGLAEGNGGRRVWIAGPGRHWSVPVRAGFGIGYYADCDEGPDIKTDLSWRQPVG